MRDVYPSTLDTAHAVAVQQDGDLVAAGAGSLSSLSTTVALARWTPEGRMDATFGGVPPAAPGTVSAFSLGSLAHAIALAGRSTRPLRAGGRGRLIADGGRVA